MSKHVLLGTLALILVPASASAQGICPLNGTSSGKLVCVVPQTFGPFGLGSGTGAPLIANGHQAHFEGDFLSSFGPINEAVGVQVSQLPIASPSSGITFTYDPALKTFAPSTEESLGPILGERASTIGRNKLYVAFSFQYFNFNSIDGQNSSNIPAVLKHQPFPGFGPSFPGFLQACPNQTGLTGSYAGNPCFVRDFVQTTNNIDLTVHQYTLYATYGISRHFDVSVAVPILDVSLKVTSNATINQNSFTSAGTAFHQFNPSIVPGCTATPCLNATFSSSAAATGIGDVDLPGKSLVYHWSGC